MTDNIKNQIKKREIFCAPVTKSGIISLIFKEQSKINNEKYNR